MFLWCLSPLHSQCLPPPQPPGLWCRRCCLKKEQQASRPPRLSLSDVLSLGERERAGKSCGRGGDQTSKSSLQRLRSSFTESAGQRWLPATREIQLHLTGLDLFLHFHPSPPSYYGQRLLSSTFLLHCGDPDPRCAGQLRLLASQFRMLALSWAPVYRPCLALASRERGQPQPIASPPWLSASEACSLLPEPVERLKLDV